MASAIQSFGGGLPGVAYIEILGGQNGDTWWNLNEITIGTATSTAMPFRIDWLNSVTGFNQTYTVYLINQVQPSTSTGIDIGGATPSIAYLTDGNSTTGMSVNGTGFAGITTSRIRLARPDNLLSFSIVNCVDNLASRMWNCRVTVYSMNNTILDQYTLPASLWVRNGAGFWSYTKSYVTSQIAPISAPTQVPSCVLWLDGADASSFVLSGSNVTTWNDKSGQGYNTSNLTGTPTYSSNGVNFTGSQAMGTNLGYAATLSNSTMFCITSYTSAFNGAFIETNVAGGNSGSGIDFFVSGGQQTVNGWATGTIVNGATGITVNTRNMHEFSFATGSSGIAILYLNGTQSGTNNSVNFTYTLGGLFSLGNWKNGGSYGTFFTGVINEVVVYSSILTTFQRQAVEGYLAWKWGLQGNLPAGHPFKTSSLGFFGFPLQLKMSSLVPVSQKSVFYGTGTIQTFAAPAGVYSIRFFLWGAGGVGQGNNFNAPTVGGGAYVEGNLVTSPGTQYFIIVGRPEQSGLANGGGTLLGEGGGGFSGIFSASPAANTVIAIAGGGGGSGYNANGFGGGGGYPNGSAGVQSGVGNQGGGGTQTAGGASLATAGAELAGGNGGSGDNGGGGGGGGWYGGGGGTNQGGGGGGSSTYISSVFNPVTANGGNGGPTQVTPTPAGGEFSPAWISPYGRGGKDGLVVIGYSPIPLTPVVFTYTGADQTYVVPSNVTAIQTYIWGAGAGGGGAGAFANGMIRVTPGSTLTIMVGQAGFYGNVTKTYGGGGAGTGNSGSGGGRSAIMVGATDLVILGGGGGQGYQFNLGGAATFSGTANSSPTVGGTTATGGSQVAGGSVGGTLYFGGDGQSYAGGGGGGYYGGGGGQYVPGVGGGGGGGGSSYTNGPNYTLLEGLNSPDGTSAPGSNYPGFQNNAGAAGANGLVILIPSPSTPPFAPSYGVTSYTGPFRSSTSFLGTGTLQTFTVPAGVSLIRIFAWGAGGIGQNGANLQAAGSGAYAAGTLRVVPGQVFYVVVGRPGQTGINNGGGSGGGTGANGGGFSGVFRGTPASFFNVLLIAGGGGGSGFNGNGKGGGGGYPNGASGVAAGVGQQGGGGTQTGGGTSTATAGSQFAGGGSGNGGGGGGGWYGGGGGNNQGGGGGGSGYLLPELRGTETVNGGNGGTNGLNPIPAANESSPYWQTPYGRSGQNGLVVIAY